MRGRQIPPVPLIVAFALGGLAPVSGFVFGLPGNGEFVPIVWILSFVALLIAPGRHGFVALIAGAALSATILDLSDGSFGLVFLIVAVVTALASHGALCASVIHRWWSLGWRAGLRDPRVIGGAALARAGAAVRPRCHRLRSQSAVDR